jgi:hypothetical protein
MPFTRVMAVVFAFSAVVLAQAPPELPEFLQKQLGMTVSELDSMEKGQILAKLPKTTETREVAAFAVMRLDISSDFFIERVRDIVTFKKSDNVLQIGKFSDPPTLEDLASLTLDPVDIESIKRCRAGSCDLKMSVPMIERLRKEINWAAPVNPTKVTALFRQIVLDRVRNYLQGGNRALGEYNDRSYRLRLADEFGTLLQPANYMYGYMPEFQKYLQEFPSSRPAEVEDFVYWSKEKFGLKPVISVTHVTLYKFKTRHGTDVLIASKGIYATHYFEVSLGLTGFIQNPLPSGAPRSYLIYINRSRTDALRGLFGGLKRSLISGSLRDGAKKNMEMIKTKLERDYRKQS